MFNATTHHNQRRNINNLYSYVGYECIDNDYSADIIIKYTKTTLRCIYIYNLYARQRV